MIKTADCLVIKRLMVYDSKHILIQGMQYIPTITNYTKLWWVHNVIVGLVAHQKEGIEAIHLPTGRTLSKVAVPVREQLFNVSICHHAAFNFLHYGEHSRNFADTRDISSLETDDFSNDGLTDVTVMTSNGINGFVQTRQPGALFFSSLVGCVLVVIFVTQHLNSIKSKPRTSSSF